MYKKVGWSLIAVVYLGLYIMVADAMFFGGVSTSGYVKSELMFGSVSILGAFITMTIILLVVCNYAIDFYYRDKNNK